MWVSGASFGIGGREDSVDKHKGPNDLSTKTITLGVAVGYNIGSATQGGVLVLTLETFHHTGTTDGSETLHHHVEHGSCQWKFPRQ